MDRAATLRGTVWGALFLASAGTALAQPPDGVVPAPQPVPYRVRAQTQYPRDGSIEAIDLWLKDEYVRLAEAGTMVIPGQWEVLVSVMVRADALPRDQWAILSRRCAQTIEDGTPEARIAALNFASQHLQQAAMSDKTLTDAYAPELTGAIAKALASDDPGTRRAAIGAANGARQLGTDSLAVVPALIACLRDPDDMVRATAAGAFFSLALARDGSFEGYGAHGPAVVAAMLKAIDDPNQRVRMHAYSALGAAGEAGRAAVPTLVKRIGSDDRAARRLCLLALQNLGPNAVAAIPALIEALRSSDERVRSGAALALGRIGPEARAAVPALVAALDDPTDSVTWYAARALSEIGPDAAAALPRLRSAVEKDDQAFGGYGPVAITRITAAPK